MMMPFTNSWRFHCIGQCYLDEVNGERAVTAATYGAALRARAGGRAPRQP
jgi:hypothetical protein